MDFKTLLLIMAIVMVGMAWYANSSKRDKIHCSFRRVNKTKINKLVKMRSRYVIFDGKKFDIIPSCIVFEWWDKGLIGMLFPQWVACLDYSHDNRFPHDPNTMKPVIMSPEARNAMNKEEMWRSYQRTQAPVKAAKQSMLQQYLPLATIMLVVLAGFFLYTNIQGIQQHVAMIENTLRAITK